MNPSAELFGFGIRIQFKWFWPQIHLDWKSWIESDLILVRIENLELTPIDSDWDGLIFNRITSNEIEITFRIESEKSDWFGMNFNPELLPA